VSLHPSWGVGSAEEESTNISIERFVSGSDRNIRSAIAP
jgi:hypothetical protein